jgi:hypothetical protein
MKTLITILLILTCLVSFGQVAPGKLVTIQNATTAFGQPLSKTDMVKDANTGKVYNVLLSLASTKTIATCTLGTDIIELPSTSTVSIAQGSFTPTVTGMTNVTTTAFERAIFTSVNNCVHVKVSGTITSPSAGFTKISITVPPGYNIGSNDHDGTVGSGVVDEDTQLDFVPGMVDAFASTYVYFSFSSLVSGPKRFNLTFDYFKE